MDKQLLLTRLTVQENPGLALTDPRFNELSTHIQNADFAEVTRLAETILKEEIYDVRVICYFLYGIFMAHGVAGLPDIFKSISMIFTDNWEAVGPRRNKEKQIANSLNWLFKQLNRKIDYEEKKESPEWIKWQQMPDAADTAQEAIDLCTGLQKVLSQHLEDLASHLVDGISSLKTWLEAFLRLVYKPEPEEAPGEEAESGPEPAAPVEKPPETQTPAPPPPQMTVQGNYHLTQLHRKIAAFKSLVEKRKYEQASLVAFDIDHIIEHFDPRRYFPEIFAEFSLLYAMNIKEILTAKNYVASSEWKALQSIYEVDIDRFSDMDLDIDFSDLHLTSGPGRNEGDEDE